MSRLTDQQRSELDRLIDRMCDQIATTDEMARLGRWLIDDPDAQEHYVACLETHARLAWQMAPGKPFLAEELVLFSAADVKNDSVAIPPIVVDSTTNAHILPGSYLFSYGVAIVLLVMALLAGLAWRISSPLSGMPEMPVVKTQVVGHITALADCQWQKTRSGVRGPGSGISEIQIPKSPNPQIPVVLGDRLHLASGLMEITYKSGAKVLLQGPCSYEIDAMDGGYLAMGKLTAKVEKGSGARGPGSGNANHSPLSSLPSPLFAVRTPTAIVTDLGTEFGVEVEQSGATRSHVFQGTIELRASNQHKSATPNAPVEILHAGQSACVEHSKYQKAVIIRGSGQPNRFVREIVQSPNQQISKSSNPQSLPPNLSYRLTDLGTLGGEVSCAIAVNTSGQIVGEALTTDGKMHAFLYENGEMKDLGTLRGGNSRAYGINSFGKIVGQSGTNDTQRAFVYSNGAMKDIGTFGGATACATGINDSDIMAGYAKTSRGITRAFLYDGKKGMRDLGALGGPKANSWANGLNASSLVTGYSETLNGAIHAFLYSNVSGMKDLGTLGGGQSKAFRINDLGQTVGQSIARDGHQYAFVYRDGWGMQKITPKQTVAEGQAIDINNQGQIVGVVEYIEGDRRRSDAFLYSSGNTVVLDSLIHPETDWTDLFPTAINDSGWIVGFGRAPNGYTRAFLLTPATKQEVRQ